jgi:hypothetical protein
MEHCYEVVKLEAFFKAVAKLTLNHDTLGDHAVVFPSKLGEELAKVDPEWWMNKSMHQEVDI